MKKIIDVIRRPWVWRAGLVLYVLCLCGVIFAYFVVSAMQVPTALYLHGPTQIEPGQPVAMRGHLLDAQNGQKIGQLHSLSLTLEQGATSLPLPTPEVHRSGEMLVRFEVPESLPGGEHELVLRARREVDSPEFVARAPLQVNDASARAESRQGSHTISFPAATPRRPARESGALPRTGVLESDGEVAIDLMEERAVLGNGLPGTLTLRTTRRDTGEPMRCEVTFLTSKGMVDGEPLPGSVTTDAFGLVTLRFSPITLHRWELEADCARGEEPAAKGTARIQVDVATTQIELTAIDPMPRPGEPLSANVTSIHREGSALIDLYHGEQWLWAGTFGFRDYRGGVTLPQMPTTPGLYRVQAHGDVYDAGFAWDAAHFFIPHPPSPPNIDPLEQAIDELLAAHLVHVTDEDRKRRIAWLVENPERWRGGPAASKRRLRDGLIAAIPVRFVSSKPLVNSFDEDQRELDAWKQGIRNELLALVAAALLVGLALLASVVLWGIDQAQRRQRLYDELSEELGEVDEGDEIARARRQRASRVMIWVQGGVLFGTLVVFAACIWMLMRYMM